MPDILKYRRSDLDRILSPQPRTLLRAVAEAASGRRLPLYLVGGFVRDLLLGLPASDFDLVVEGDAIALARAVARRSGGRVTVHSRFGTARWFPPEAGQPALDFISARSESYERKAVLPSVKPGTLADDLARRDFSINTLALRLDGEHWGELRDDLGSLDDLKKGLVRVLHRDSFEDDPTRLFRAVRYEQRYGFRIAPETAALMPPAIPLIGSLSAARIRHELDLVLEEQRCAAMLERLAALGLLDPVHPALQWDEQTQERFLSAQRRLAQSSIQPLKRPGAKSFFGWHFWLAGTAVPDLQSLEQRLHFRAELFRSLLAASALHAELASLAGEKPSRWVRRLDGLPLTAVQAVFLVAPQGKGREDLSNYLESWRQVKPGTDGHALKKRGLPPGPRYQQILSRLRDAWLDGEVHTAGEESRLLDELIGSV